MRGMIIIAAAAAFLPAMSQAQTRLNCGEREQVTQHLAKKYGEHLGGAGIRNQQTMVEVWFSKDNGTWTILMTRADGKSCIVASGTNWLERQPNEMVVGIPG